MRGSAAGNVLEPVQLSLPLPALLKDGPSTCGCMAPFRLLQRLKAAKEVAPFGTQGRRVSFAQQRREIAAKRLDSPATGLHHHQSQPWMNAEGRHMAPFLGDLPFAINEAELLQLLTPFKKESLRRWLQPGKLLS